MRISDWSSDVCSSDLHRRGACSCHRTGCQHLNGFVYKVLKLRIKINEWREIGLNLLDSVRQNPKPIRRRDNDQHQRHIGDRQKENNRSEEHTSELQSLMRISYAVFCLKKTK